MKWVICILILLIIGVPVSADVTYFELADPYNNTGTNTSTPDFIFYIGYNDSTNTSDCELLIGGVAYGRNSSVLNYTETTITANSSLSDGSYTWILNCTTDDDIHLDFTFNRLLYIDTIVPNVTFVYPTPTNNSNININNDNYYITLNATYNDSGVVVSCIAEVNGNYHIMDVYDGYCVNNIAYLQEGSQDYVVRVYDKANVGESGTNTMTIDVIRFVEQNRIYAVIPPLFWGILAIFVFLLWEWFSLIDKKTLMHVGVALMIFVSFIISLTITLGLVV